MSMRFFTVRRRHALMLAMISGALLLPTRMGDACTFITLSGRDGTVVVGRTMEWAAFDIKPRLTVVPGGKDLTATPMPDGKAGASWTAEYGLVGIDLLEHLWFGDAVNEKGLSVSLLYLPGFAEYQTYDAAQAENSITQVDLPLWIATQFETVAEVRAALERIRVVPFSLDVVGGVVPVHYVISDPSKDQIVVEYVGGELQVHDAPLGVMTNSPPYDWHLTNLRNYLNLRAVAWPDVKIADMDLKPIGVGSGFLGLPGDFTPPSRFVRAVAFTQTARPTEGGFDTVREHFRIMDSFNVPIDAVTADELPVGLDPLCCSGTQYTVAIDLKNLVLYYHTDTSRRIRMVNVGTIDFGAIGDEVIHRPLRVEEEESVKEIKPVG